MKRAQLSKASHSLGHQIQGEFNLLGTVLLAETKTQAGAGTRSRQSHGGEHVRRLDRPRRARRSGRNRQTLEVQGDDEGLTLQKIEIEIAGIGNARGTVAIHAGGLYFSENLLLEAIPEGGDSFEFSAKERVPSYLRRPAQADDPGDIFRSRAPGTLVIPP